MKKLIILILLISCLIVAGCQKAQPSDSNIVIKSHEDINDSTNVVDTDIEEDNNSKQTSDEAKKITDDKNTSNEEIKQKSIKRKTSVNLEELNLKDDDSYNYFEEEKKFNKEFTDADLKENNALEGHQKTYYYNEDENDGDSNKLISATIYRKTTDIIDDFIKNKKFDEELKDKENIYSANIGEYNVMYSELSQGSTYKSATTIKFIKYDIFVEIIVYSQSYIFEDDDAKLFARKIENRIQQ